MGTVVANIGANIASQLGTTFATPLISVPNTQIINRAQCVDPANDLLPRYGLTRYYFQQLMQVQGETGPASAFNPSGMTVWKPVNDWMDRVRFCGPWFSNTTTSGTEIVNPNSQTGEYIEIVFYGTGFNLLYDPGSAGTMLYSVDGGASTAFSLTTNSTNAGQAASALTVLPIVSGLTLGTHVITLTCNGSGNADTVYGYEVVVNPATATNLTLVPGTVYNGSSAYTLASLSTMPYNSGFTSGTLGTKGGHAVVYITQGGTIQSAVQPTDTTQGNLATGTPATHANEEVIRSFTWRDFGNGASADFSTVTTAGAAVHAWVLADNSHSLKASASIATNPTTASFPSAYDELYISTTNDFITLTFIGTGLDIVRTDTSQSGTPDTVSVTVDGTNIGNLSSVVSQQIRTEKIVSGLPYGTHTVTFTKTAANSFRVGFLQFITYGPKKPTLPSNSVELCDYFIVAPYAIANVPAGNDQPSQGVITKSAFREGRFTGTGWATNVNLPNTRAGIYQQTSSTGTTVNYTFWGTGFEWGQNQGSGNATWSVAINGGALSGNYTGSMTVYSNGGGTTSGTPFNGPTFISGSNSRLVVTGLPLNLYTVTFTWVSGSTLVQHLYFDEITPVHSPKFPMSNGAGGPGVIGDLDAMGHTSLGDSRKFSSTQTNLPNAWSQVPNGNSGVSTTTNTVIGGATVPDLAVKIKTSGKPIDISFNVSMSTNTAGAGAFFSIAVDGIFYGREKLGENSANFSFSVSDRLIVPVCAGHHLVEVYWAMTSGTGALNKRDLSVREIS